MVKLVIPISPCPASRPRVARWGTYYAKNYAEFKKQCPWLIKSLYRDKPIGTAISMKAVFYMEIPASYSNKRRLSLDGQVHTSRGDIDNHLKSILDSMNEIVFVDDALVYEVYAKKVWSLNPRIEIEITTL